MKMTTPTTSKVGIPTKNTSASGTAISSEISQRRPRRARIHSKMTTRRKAHMAAPGGGTQSYG